jgi:hypothetical protein
MRTGRTNGKGELAKTKVDSRDFQSSQVKQDKSLGKRARHLKRVELMEQLTCLFRVAGTHNSGDKFYDLRNTCHQHALFNQQ